MPLPPSTYRLQLTANFTLDDAAALVPYFVDLGVGWLYLSPILQSASGSTHGYDVVDPTRVDTARGGKDALVRLARTAHEAGLGILVDIVPNHVGVGVPHENPWWWDVLRLGQGSRYAKFFDIDWAAGRGRLLLPVVGDEDMPSQPGGAIRGMSIDTEAGLLRYHDREYPLAPGSADDTGAGVRAIHAAQHYELVHWRRGDWELNYRRFFTITDLAGVRVEDAEVWEAAHAEILSWVRDGLVDGLRVDHVDGLRDPGGYLARLRERAGVPVWVEKILEPGEQLPDWPVAGTTGYDALGEYDRMLIDDDSRDDLDDDALDWGELVHTAKRFVTDGPLQAEMLRIARDLGAGAHGTAAAGSDGTAAAGAHATAAAEAQDAVAPASPASPAPATAAETVDAVSEIAACFGVYRTYLPIGREHLDAAVNQARVRRPELAATIERVADILSRPEHPAAARFQQTTGMVMAKAVEDRSFYRYSRLTSLNEVGGDPSVFSLTPDAFHELQQRRQQRWPHTLTTLTTHDTKRSEDVRARIDALAEYPALWRDSLDQLREIAPIDNPDFANLLWQAIVGAWPASRERLNAYAEKAAREAGEDTTWTEVNGEYEASLHAAVDAAFAHPAARSILQNLVETLDAAATSNALALKTLQLLGPGIPDVYQGSELWLRALVDPDNRRPVDWRQRRAALDAVLAGARPTLSGTESGDEPGNADPTGAVKLLITVAGLRIRRSLPDRFTQYVPLRVSGASAEHVLAFDRGGVIAAVTRLPVALEAGGGWLDTRLELPAGRWIDQLSGNPFTGTVAVAQLFAPRPVAMLVRESGV